MTDQRDNIEDVVQAVVEANALFDEVCQALHNENENPLAFLQSDNFNDLLGTLAETANLARYQFVQIILTSGKRAAQEPELGGDSFKSAGEDWGNVRNRGEWKDRSSD